MLVVLLIVSSGSVAYARFAGGSLYTDEIWQECLGYAILHGHLEAGSPFGCPYGQFGLVAKRGLDHPPLMGLMMALVLAAGLTPRFLPITFCTITNLVMFIMLRKRFVLATATALSFVFYQQYHQLLSMAFLDPGVSMFLMSTIALTYLYRRVKNSRLLPLAGVTAGLATLSKEIGVASILYLILFTIYDVRRGKRGKWGTHLEAIIIAFCLGAVWPIYGLALQPKLFLDLIGHNAGRSILGTYGWQITMYSAVGVVYFRRDYFGWNGYDYVLVASWLATVYMFVRARGISEVKLGLLCFGSIFLLLRYPAIYLTISFFPFYSIAFGTITEDAYNYMMCTSGKRSYSRLESKGS